MARTDLYRVVFALGVTAFLGAFGMGFLQAWLRYRTPPNLSIDHLAQAKEALLAGDTAGAITQLRTYARIEPRQPEGWARLGQALAAVGDRAGAIAAFEQSLRFLPVPVTVHQHLAILYRQEGRVEDARQHALIAERAGAPVPRTLEQALARTFESSR